MTIHVLNHRIQLTVTPHVRRRRNRRRTTRAGLSRLELLTVAAGLATLAVNLVAL